VDRSRTLPLDNAARLELEAMAGGDREPAANVPSMPPVAAPAGAVGASAPASAIGKEDPNHEALEARDPK